MTLGVEGNAVLFSSRTHAPQGNWVTDDLGSLWPLGTHPEGLFWKR